MSRPLGVRSLSPRSHHPVSTFQPDSRLQRPTSHALGPPARPRCWQLTIDPAQHGPGHHANMVIPDDREWSAKNDDPAVRSVSNRVVVHSAVGTAERDAVCPLALVQLRVIGGGLTSPQVSCPHGPMSLCCTVEFEHLSSPSMLRCQPSGTHPTSLSPAAASTFISAPAHSPSSWVTRPTYMCRHVQPRGLNVRTYSMIWPALLPPISIFPPSFGLGVGGFPILLPSIWCQPSVSPPSASASATFSLSTALLVSPTTTHLDIPQLNPV